MWVRITSWCKILTKVKCKKQIELNLPFKTITKRRDVDFVVKGSSLDERRYHLQGFTSKKGRTWYVWCPSDQPTRFYGESDQTHDPRWNCQAPRGKAIGKPGCYSTISQVPINNFKTSRNRKLLVKTGSNPQSLHICIKYLGATSFKERTNLICPSEQPIGVQIQPTHVEVVKLAGVKTRWDKNMERS